jgi:hypothetical protein
MLLMLYAHDEGPTDIDHKRGDIFAVFPDDHVPGTEEVKKWVFAKVSDYGGDWNELVQPEYAATSTPQRPVYRHMRKYGVAWWEKMSGDEIGAYDDTSTAKPVVEGRYDLADIKRK